MALQRRRRGPRLTLRPVAHVVLLRDHLSNPPKHLKALVSALSSPPKAGPPGPETDESARFEIRTLVVQPNQKLPAETVDELVARYQAGESIRGLGRSLGAHEQTIRAHLRRRGVKLRPVRALTDAQLAEAAQLYGEGWSTFRLAERYGVGATTVGVNLRRAGLRLRPRGWNLPVDEGRLGTRE